MKPSKRKTAQMTRMDVLLSQAVAMGVMMPEQATAMRETVKTQVLGIRAPETNKGPLAELEGSIADFDAQRETGL